MTNRSRAAPGVHRRPLFGCGRHGGRLSVHGLPGRGLWERIGLRQGLSALDISSVTYAAPHLFFGTLGAGLSVLDESLVLNGSSGIE